MNSLPSKEELLAFQARWQKPAGLAALVAAFVVAVSIVLQRAGLDLPSGNSDADQLAFVDTHSARLIYSSVIQAIGFALLLVPLLFLFRSASGRAERMRGAFAGLIALGPLAFGIGLAVSSVGSSDAADKFTTQEPAVVQQARQQAQAAQAPAPAAPKKSKPAGGSTTTTTTTSSTAAAKPKTPDQAASDAREGLADHLNKHTTLLVVGGVVSTVGVLALVFGMIYTNLWSMRVGLLTRFWGALGMAFGLFLVIPLFPPIPGLVLWFAVIGLMLLGFWPRPLPPAWAAGEAIPWQRPGDDVGQPAGGQGPAGTVEGSGREISEPPLPEEAGAKGEAGGAGGRAPGETQGRRPKKRKRRR
ncbi:MAG: hypothetical protein ACM31K_03145 [Solirubrobacterales bacterium]